MSKEKWTINNIPELSGKVIIVTGGNSGLGYESVKALAGKGAEVILTSRSPEKGEAAKTRILETNPESNVTVMRLDLQDLSSVRTFSNKFREKYDRLNVLLNNAGIMASPYFLTKDGFEGQMGTNHLGHFALTGLLMDLIKRTPDSRVVNVSSSAHKYGKMDFDNLLFNEGRDYSPIKAYGRSKLCNLLFTYELQRYFEANNIKSMAVAAHPGASSTSLDRYIRKNFWVRMLWPLMKSISQSAAMGALPQIRASVAPDVKGSDFYGPGGFKEIKGYPVLVTSNRDSYNTEDAQKLWESSEKLTGITIKA